MKPIIFTDLDGTLLSFADYSFEKASSALNRIKRNAIPLVYSSSKTAKEIEAIRLRTDNSHPFVSENGGGIFIPAGYFPFSTGGVLTGDYRVITLGRPYSEVRAALVDIRSKIKTSIKGFGDMTVREIALATGLSTAEAELAKQRDFDEPFIFDGTHADEVRLAALIREHGLTWTRGRFHHILGDHDKGKALKILKAYYEKRYGVVVTICLGDGANDIPLLKEADYPVLVRKPGGEYEETLLTGVIRADGAGPEGWNSAVNRIIDELERAGLMKA